MLSTDMHLTITGKQQAEREQRQLIREQPLRRPDGAQSHSRAGRAPAMGPARGMATSPAWPWPAGCAASTPGSVRLTCAARPQASSAAASYALRARAGPGDRSRSKTGRRLRRNLLIQTQGLGARLNRP